MDEWFEHSPFVGFAPWILYWVVAGSSSTWLYAGMVTGATDMDWQARLRTTD
ncbi:hypothetical protein O6P37_17840 [Mycobacterium sp. CPCC 205372]|uniref:Uncharacterized protein n=1 Tax=Mycobacterium hippophais TaxID=3016340 RepID=A0ABT4PW11_9MYCO|nr:hypothetical protein [Mycobacterium hippophais]MCZ8380733.1 hypothetical protein [Mycobacterium hippophais]